MAKLGELCKIQAGGTPSRADVSYWENGKIPWVKISDIKTKYIDCVEEHITESGLENSSAKIFPAGTILYTIFATLGETCILNIDAATNQAIAGIQIESDLILRDYLYYYLLSQKSNVSAMGRGVAQNNINMKMLKDFEVPLPPLEEQRHIAAVLDKVTDLIAQRRAQLDKLDLLVKSRFVEMFGDPVDNSHGWDTIKLKDIGTCKNGMNFHTDDFGVKIHCLGVADFKDYSFIEGTSQLSVISLNETPTEEYLLKNGDIVFVRSNGNKSLVGRSVLVYPGTTPTTFSGFCIRFRLQSESIRPIYLLRVLKTDSIRKKLAGRGANIQNLNQKILLELSIPVPPLVLQDSFENFEKGITKLRTPVNQSLNRLGILKKVLMQKYFE